MNPALFTNPDAYVVALEASAFNALVTDAMGELTSGILASALFARRPSGGDGEKRNLLRTAMPASAVSVDARLSAAIVTVSGIISVFADDLDRQAVDPRGLVATLRQLHAAGIHTAILHIDSPGGHALGMEDMSADLKALRADGMELVAFSDKVMASAAYWLASCCDVIITTPVSASGSIGVYSVVYTFDGLFEKLGIKANVFRDGPLKGMGFFGKPLTREESNHIDARVARASAAFKGHVVSARPGKVALAAMNGQVFEGKDALAVGLVDFLAADLETAAAAVLSNRK